MEQFQKFFFVSIPFFILHPIVVEIFVENAFLTEFLKWSLTAKVPDLNEIHYREAWGSLETSLSIGDKNDLESLTSKSDYKTLTK